LQWYTFASTFTQQIIIYPREIEKLTYQFTPNTVILQAHTYKDAHCNE